jgi:hypothetical protein
MTYQRLQATLFLPQRTALLVDELRRRWDPVMTDRIRPHVTGLRRVPDAELLLATLRSATEVRACRLHLGAPARASQDQGAGIYLQVTDPYHDMSLLWSALRDCCTEPDVLQGSPHVTVVHPRTAPPERVSQAWTELSHVSMSQDFVVGEIALIGETRDKWETIESIPLVAT